MFIRIFAGFLIVALNGCASIVSQSVYPVNITSARQPLDFVIFNHHNISVKQGHTPEIVPLESGAGFFKRAVYHIYFSKKGHSVSQITVYSRMDGWFFGNLAVGLLGMITVDPATGAMWKLPERVVAPVSNNSQGVIDVND